MHEGVMRLGTQAKTKIRRQDRVLTRFLSTLILFYSTASFAAPLYCLDVFNKLNNVVSYREIASSKQPRKVLFDFFLKEFKGKYRLFAEFFYDRNGKNVGLDFIGQVKAINPEWEKLVVYPGLVERQKDFLKFVRTHKLQKKKALEAYKAYADSLGNAVVYRAITLDKTLKLEDLKNQAFTSKLIYEANQKVPDREILISNLTHELAKHMRKGDSAIVMSITDHPEVALAVGSKLLEEVRDTKQLVLFKLSIPKIDIISADEKSLFAGASYEDKSIWITKNTGKRTVDIGHYKLDRKVESFVLGGIHANEVQSIEFPKAEYGYYFGYD